MIKRLFIKNLIYSFEISLLLLASLISSCQTTMRSKSVSSQNKELKKYAYLMSDRRALRPHAEMKEIKSTILVLKSQLSRDTKNIGLLVTLAEHLLAVGDLSGAEVYSKRALQIDFRESAPKAVLAHVAYLRGHYLKSEAILESVLAEKNAMSSELLNLAGCIAMNKHDDALALKYFERAIAKNTQDVAALLNLGLINLKRMNPAEAESRFKEAMKIIPDNPDILMHLGIAHAMQGELDQAQARYEQIPKAYRNQPLFLFNLAILKKRQGDFDGAVADLKKYLKTSQGHKIHEEQVNGLMADLIKKKSQENDASQPADIAKKATKPRKNPGEESSSGFVVSGSVGAFQDEE